MNRTTPLTIEETRAIWRRLRAILDSTELSDIKFKARRPDPNEAASFLFWYCDAAEDAFWEIEKILDHDFPDWAKQDGTQEGGEG